MSLWDGKFKIPVASGGRECPKDNPVIGISEDGYEIRKNNNGHFGGTYSEWYYIFIDDKPVITDKYGVRKERKERTYEEAIAEAENVSKQMQNIENGLPAEESTESKKNILLFAGLGVLIWIFLKKR